MNQVKNVFLIDDDPTFVFLTKRMIVATGLAIKINEFNDGQSAIDFLTEHSGEAEMLPDVIFLDLSMPIMDGWDFLQEYLTVEPNLGKRNILYIVSSSISPHDIERAKHFSMVTDFIIKPLVKEKFIEIIENLSDSSNPLQSVS